MTEQTTEALIAEARVIWEADDLYPDQMIPRLVKALEAAEQRAAEYAAVLEKVRAYAESIPRTRDRDVNPGLSNRSWLTAQDVLYVLTSAGADVLREHDAKVRAEALREHSKKLAQEQMDTYGIVLPEVHEIIDGMDEEADRIEREAGLA